MNGFMTQNDYPQHLELWRNPIPIRAGWFHSKIRWEDLQRRMTFEQADRQLKSAGYGKTYKGVSVSYLNGGPVGYCFSAVAVAQQKMAYVFVDAVTGVVKEVPICLEGA